MRFDRVIVLTMLAFTMGIVLAHPWAPSQAAQNSVAGGRTEGKQIFVSSCGTCHGMDGRGGVHAPGIAASAAVERLSDEEIERIVRNGIPSGGMPSFRALGPGKIQAVVAYLRALQGKQSAAPVTGNPARGRQLFFGPARCAACHMIDGKGGFLGPDLTSYSRSHSPSEMREAIVNPGKNLRLVEDTVVAVTRSGHKLVGIARNEDNFSLQLQTPDGVFHLLMKSSLKRLRHEPRSLMPADYGSKLSGQELDDIVSFIARHHEAARTGGQGTPRLTEKEQLQAKG